MKYILIACLVILTACTKPDTTRRVLTSQGYTEIQITGYKFFTCAEEDMFSTGFTAQKNGFTVSGVVCAGLFKGQTIRLD